MQQYRVTEIDLLRFFAALSVIFFHYSFKGYADGRITISFLTLGGVSKYGYLGVELFFLISGFVILLTASSCDLKKFIISRLVRLYPTFWICCTLTFIITGLFGTSNLKGSISDYLVNLTMLNGFFGVKSIDGVYWSLFVEIKFYFLITLLILINQIKNSIVFLLLWLGCIVVLHIYPISILKTVLIFDYSPFFIAGATFFLVYSRGLSFVKVLILICTLIIGAYHSLQAIPQLEQHFNSEFNKYIVIGVILMFFLVFYLIATKRTGVIGKINWLTLGSITYPIYLIHQNIGFALINLTCNIFNKYIVFCGTIFIIIISSLLINKLFVKNFSKKLKKYFENFRGIKCRIQIENESRV